MTYDLQMGIDKPPEVLKTILFLGVRFPRPVSLSSLNLHCFCDYQCINLISPTELNQNDVPRNHEHSNFYDQPGNWSIKDLKPQV